MPFDVLPQEVQTETKFRKFADAMLKGCAMRPIQCSGRFLAGEEQACALGALAVGLGFIPEDGEDVHEAVESFLPNSVCLAYEKRYGDGIPDDNDYNGFTREQIAARIAAL